MLRPVGAWNSLRASKVNFDCMHMHQFSFKDDTFPLEPLRLPDISSRLKVLQYSR